MNANHSRPSRKVCQNTDKKQPNVRFIRRKEFLPKIVSNFKMMTVHLAMGVVLHGIIIARNMSTAEFTVVNDLPFAGKLYLDIQNDERPPPSEMDADPETRKQICADITSSLYFLEIRRDPVNMNKDRTRRKLKRKKYREIFDTIYQETLNQRCFRCKLQYEYANPYRLRAVNIDTPKKPIETRQDWAFMCLVKTRRRKTTKKKLIPYYVSKEYNVMAGQISQLRIAGRFVFKPPPSNIQMVLLAEEPAKVYESEDFDLERYYLTVRRDLRPEDELRNDPLCQLTLGIYRQNERICRSMLGSAKIITEYRYDNVRHYRDDCYRREVSFKSEILQREASRSGRYHEWMIYCRARVIETNAEAHFWVSRAYKSGQMFLYRYGASLEYIHLENLSTNVSILDPEDEDDYAEWATPESGVKL